jgi:hypothetical protein
MTTLIMATATAPRAAVDSTFRSSALASWWSDAASACMAARIIGTGRPDVHPGRRSALALSVGASPRITAQDRHES